MCLGVVLIILGLVCAGYGYTQNNTLEAQISSLLQSGATNPGTIFIFLGIGVAIVGVLLCIYSIVRKK
ncbi:hypothetical protein B5F98_00170 [Pseudoflavonifractor sp. An44]|nr:hypothetical protein B5F98_00170 [Pseudoflavonifractor sp. An44]